MIKMSFFHNLALKIQEMEETTRAVVLHLQKCGEDKAVVWLYTENRGAMSFMARMPKQRRAGTYATLLRTLNILDISYDYRPKSKFQKFGEVRVSEPFKTLPYDPMKATLALFLGEVLYYVLRNEVRNEPLFQYLCYGLAWLDNCQRAVANFHLVFLMRLTRFLGFWPNAEDWFPGASYDLQSCKFTKMQPPSGASLVPEEAAILPVMLRMNFNSMHLFRFNRMQRQQFIDAVMRYYRLHLPDFPEPKSSQVLREVLG